MKAFGLKRNVLLLMWVLALLAVIFGTATAKQYTWNGVAEGKWNDLSNWSPQGVLSENDEVIFPSNSCILVTEPVTVNSIVCNHLKNMEIKLQANLTTSSLTIPNKNTYVKLEGEGAFSVTDDGLRIIAGSNKNEA